MRLVSVQIVMDDADRQKGRQSKNVFRSHFSLRISRAFYFGFPAFG
jgi:hypothetical protein